MHTVQRFAFTWLVMSTPCAQAAQEQGDPEARLDAIIAEYDAAMETYVRAWNEAPEEDRASVTERLYLLPDDDLIPRALAVLADCPDQELIARGLAWVVEVSRGAAGADAARVLVKDHLDSQHSKVACAYLSSDYDEGIELLTRVVEESPLRELRGHALLGRADQWKELAEIAPGLDTPEGRAQYAAWYGDAFVMRLQKAVQSSLVAHAETDYRTVIDEYGDVESEEGLLGEIAGRDLFELLHLCIGAEAPEIVGEDLHGVEFRLSDYRGKVVVLDFWGHW